MDPIILAAAVMVFVQGIKEMLLKAFKFQLCTWGVYVVVILVSCGEVVDQLLSAGKPLIAFASLWLFLKVVVGSLGGYGLVKVASGNGNVPK